MEPATASIQHRPPQQWPTIPEGCYAVVDPADGILKFFSVSKPTQGKWQGYTFVSIFASNEKYPLKNPMMRGRILLEISKDPKAAMLRYGKEIGRCGHCGRQLTNEESRAKGIGPVCEAQL